MLQCLKRSLFLLREGSDLGVSFADKTEVDGGVGIDVLGLGVWISGSGSNAGGRAARKALSSTSRERSVGVGGGSWILLGVSWSLMRLYAGGVFGEDVLVGKNSDDGSGFA